jgi:hypothetical protein
MCARGRWTIIRRTFAAFMMARAMVEMIQDEPGCPVPKALAAILQQMKRWEDEQAHHAT